MLHSKKNLKIVKKGKVFGTQRGFCVNLKKQHDERTTTNTAACSHPPTSAHQMTAWILLKTPTDAGSNVILIVTEYRMISPWY